MTVRLGIVGFGGRMGQAIARVLEAHPETTLVGGVERNVAAQIEKPNLIVTDKAETLVPLCDVVIDFSAPSVTPEVARLAAANGKAFLSGTTGLDATAKEALKVAAQKVPVLYATNTSLSLVVMKQLVKMAANLLRDQDYDIAIHDRHHRWKKDAPSGTAKTLGEWALAGNGGSKEPVFSATRAGAIVGEHEVMFAGLGETISLHHSVTDRDVFARGAVQAAIWLHGKSPALYSMDDVLGVVR
ncbi:MAG: 4-hydroxy-tetrahydrodipicolinate reductase [Alphaproteobacteria bacterium]|nr:4-hydroxy-tetrahydrodipicolinate reductase [Alphaproteobacteria bacterium]